MGALIALSLPALAQTTVYRKIGEMELRLLGVSATVDPLHPVVPKNIPSAVRIVVRAGGAELPLVDALRFLGPGVKVHGDLSGPGLPRNPEPSPVDAEATRCLPTRSCLPLPGLTVSGNYTLSNLRLESAGHRSSTSRRRP